MQSRANLTGCAGTPRDLDRAANCRIGHYCDMPPSLKTCSSTLLWFDTAATRRMFLEGFKVFPRELRCRSRQPEDDACQVKAHDSSEYVDPALTFDGETEGKRQGNDGTKP